MVKKIPFQYFLYFFFILSNENNIDTKTININIVEYFIYICI